METLFTPALGVVAPPWVVSAYEFSTGAALIDEHLTLSPVAAPAGKLLDVVVNRLAPGCVCVERYATGSGNLPVRFISRVGRTGGHWMQFWQIMMHLLHERGEHVKFILAQQSCELRALVLGPIANR